MQAEIHELVPHALGKKLIPSLTCGLSLQNQRCWMVYKSLSKKETVGGNQTSRPALRAPHWAGGEQKASSRAMKDAE